MWPTIIISIILAIIVGLIIYRLIQNKKRGKSCCSGNCVTCSCGCHENTKK